MNIPGFFIIPLLVGRVYSLIVNLYGFPYWFQMNFAEENVKSLLSNQSPYFMDVGIDPEILQKFIRQDVSGKKIIPYPAQRSNVLFIMIEGLGHDSIRSGTMPSLKDLSEKHLFYENFISLQRQTHRGMYSLLCGDLPNFLTREAKPDYVGIYGSPWACLPEILREHGYHTAFMQSADLGYMRKDKLAEEAGFEEITGSNDYKTYNAKNKWGVDDATLYSHANRRIRELQHDAKPWFMTLLTSGTHHPYLVPDVASPTLEEALQYTDDSFKEFMDNLRSSGFLENTLVFVTSDEPAFNNGEGLLYELSANHAPMTVVLPQISRPMVHDGLFTQADILLSILDYLNIDPGRYPGRSIFRTYDDERNLIFGNVHTSKVYSHSREDKLYVCTIELDCLAYRNRNNQLFDTSYAEADVDAGYLSDLKNMLAYNELNSDKLNSRYIFHESNEHYAGTRYLLGDHTLTATAGDTIRWSLKIKADDPISVFLYLLSSTNIKNFNVISQKIARVGSGETFTFTHEFNATQDIPLIWTNIIVSSDDNGEYTVERLTIEHLRGTENPS
jgi:hypothetical protein